MTANKRVTGADNEKRATEYLIDNGYSILERNFRNKTGEIDIIAKNDNLIVFVEVKYRSSKCIILQQDTKAVIFHAVLM